MLDFGWICMGEYWEAFIFWWIMSVVEKKAHNENCLQLGVKMGLKKWPLGH